MRMPLLIASLLILLALPALAAIPERLAPLELKDGAAIAKAFTPAQKDAWTTTADGYGGPGSGAWQYALAGNVTALDYSVTATVKLTKAADKQDGMELGCFAVFHNLANLGGYEAALLVGYQSPESYYRVAISSLWKEVIVWTPSGGVIAVAPYEFAAGKSYTLAVTFQRGSVAVAVDGTTLLANVHGVTAAAQGQLGLARKEGEAYFTQLQAKPIAAPRAPTAPHVPQFRERTWHNYRCYFDGAEPICVLLTSNVYDLMKFRPGYRPMLYAFNYITDWSRFYPSKITEYKVAEDGKRLVVETTAVDGRTNAAITQQARMVITYDTATDTYRYDHACVTNLTADEAGKVAQDWDHGDSVFLGGVGSSITRDPQAEKPRYLWSVFESTDGKLYKVPFNHNMFYAGTDSTNGGPLKPGGAGLIPVGDPVLSPVVQIPEMSPQIEATHVGHCWWAYDMHTQFLLKKVDGKIPAGAFTTRVVYSAMEAAAAQALLAKATYYKPRNTDVTVPLYTAGIGYTEPFDKIVNLATPHTEHRIFTGVIDATVGHTDKSSLRLDGPTEAWTLTGASYYTGAYTKRMRISGWVKTKDVKGEGPMVGFHRMDNNQFEYHFINVTGTCDWTPFSYVTAFPAGCWGVHLYWRNSGTGTVWFDDFKMEPVDDATPVDVTPYPGNPADADMVLMWSDKGDAGGVLDASWYGSHGKFYGVTWADAGGKRVMALDGKSYIWPLPSANMTLGPDTTLLFDIKPESTGQLVMWGFAFQFSLDGGPKYSLNYWAAGKNVPSKPLLDAGVWQKLAIVVTKDKISYYVNGALADEVAATPVAGNPANHTNSTFHRHLSFFGAGSADYDPAPLATPAYGCLKGQVRGMTVYKRALTAAEIGKW